MGKFFEELANKLAERWVALLLVPGVLFVALAVVGARLGHGNAVDATEGRHVVSDLAATVARQPVGVQVALLVLALLAATGTGLIVQALAPITRLVWLGQWPWFTAPLRRRLVQRRRARWQALLGRRRASQPQEQETIDALAARMNRIAPAQPGRPTWMGDRMHAVEQIALNRYGLDLTFGWARLWLVLPDAVRAELSAAEAAFASATVTGTWAVPYLALGVGWWPAVLIGVGVGLSGWLRARAAVADLAALSEAAIDLHGRALATALGVGVDDTVGPLTVEDGMQITAIVRKGR